MRRRELATDDAVADAAIAVAEMVFLGTDLTWRYLVERDVLSASATLVLNRLHHEGPMRLTALAAAEGASQSGMTQLVQRMEHQGLLQRRTDPIDGRATLVTVGEAGRQLWHARASVRQQRIAELLTTVSPDDRVEFQLAAQVVMRILGQMREVAARQD
jgi:DNA-binding MarR family transcriptional regulator